MYEMGAVLLPATMRFLRRPWIGAPLLLRAWQLAALVGLGAFALHVGAGVGGQASDHFFNRWLYSGLLVLAAGACVARGARIRAERAAWLLLGAGLTSWTIGDIYYTFAFAGNYSPPFPSLADGFYLAFYPAAYVALMLLVRARVREFERAVWLDGLLATLAAAAAGATVLVEIVLRTTHGSVAVVVTNLAYPIGDTLLLALTIGVCALTGWRPGRRWAFIGAALIASALADGIFLVQIAQGTYREGTLLDALWPAGMLLLAQAAWQRSGGATTILLEGRRALATPAACGLIGIGVLTYGHFNRLNLFAVLLAVATLVAVIVRTGITFEENHRILGRLRHMSVTDALTGLGNRRRLLSDLAEILEQKDGGPWMLVIFDLNGFKRYNDTFGHLAGDVLLARLGSKLAQAVEGIGQSYRLGGDEFCVLAPVAEDEAEPMIEATVAALCEHGDGFSVDTSFGAVYIPNEAAETTRALSKADQRLYVHKRGRESGRGQTQDVLLRALYERHPELEKRLSVIADLAFDVGRRLGLAGNDLDELRLAAQLHDVGMIAIPDAIVRKPGPLDDDEWAFIHRHTELGQRILSAAPALVGVGKLVRSTHERWDGLGYPDGIPAETIPLGSRIISACDAFGAMTSERPYRAKVTPAEALAELRRSAGTQFDPVVVGVLCALLIEPDLYAAA